MKKLVVLVLAILSLTAIGLAQNGVNSKSPEAGNAYNNGLDLARKGDFKSAVTYFEKAIQADDMFAQAYYMLGVSQKRLNKNTEAINSFKKAIEVDKKFEGAYIALGNLQASMDSYESAINSFNAVLAFNNKSAKAYYGVGNVFYKQKKYDMAIDRLKKAVEYDPSYDSAWNYLGLSQEKSNELTAATESFQKAIENTNKRSRKGSYYYRLGNVFLRLKKFNDAENAFTEALKFSKSQGIVGGANFGLGEVYKSYGQTQKAIRYYQQAAKTRSWKASADYEIDLLKNPDKYSN